MLRSKSVFTLGKKYFLLLSFLLISSFLFLASCIEIHAFFNLKPDGSGVGKITYIVVKGIYSAPDDAQLAINEEKIAETVAKKEGVKVIKTGSSYEDENRVRVWVEFEFKNINLLSDSFSQYVLEDLGDGKKELRAKVRFSGYLHRRDILKDMFKGLNSSLEVKVPGKIIGTNGKVISSDTVRWDIDAREIVGADTEKIFIVQYQEGKKGLIKRILDKLKR